MCGIYGFVSKSVKRPQEIVEGLKVLEYRGYDSWGVAIKVKSKFRVEKHVGKIGQGVLSKDISSISTNIGIGHTRWATHGGVTIENAHPHLDCTGQIAVVHNGIVENFEDLRDELEKKGHKFKSQTDTEVFPHLVEEFLREEGFASSVRDAFNKLSGLNAIVVAHSKSSQIIGVKSGSPLLVGEKNGDFYIASDVSAMLKHTRKIYFMEDNQMVILGDKMQLLQLPKGEKKEFTFQEITWKFENAVRGKFKHFFLKEICEQPEVIKNISAEYDERASQLAKLIEDGFGTFMLGCGTASYAALAGTYLFSDIAKKHVNFTIGSEFKYLEDYVTKGTLVIPISQSGETIDVVEPIARAKKRGATIAALTNVLGSTIYRHADYKFLLEAGPEISVAGTKSFTSMISVLLLVAYSLAGKQKEGKNLLLKASDNLSEILKEEYLVEIRKLAKKIKNKEHMYLIGRGMSYSIAMESALKIKEISYVHAEGFAGAELKHGFIALIEKGTPCVVFAPKDETYDEIISNAMEVKTRGGYMIGIGPENNEVFDVFLKTADIKEATMIPQVVISFDRQSRDVF